MSISILDQSEVSGVHHDGVTQKEVRLADIGEWTALQKNLPSGQVVLRVEVGIAREGD